MQIDAILASGRISSSACDPIPFRYQNRGDYDQNQMLRDDLASGESGIGVHVS